MSIYIYKYIRCESRVRRWQVQVFVPLATPHILNVRDLFAGDAVGRDIRQVACESRVRTTENLSKTSTEVLLPELLLVLLLLVLLTSSKVEPEENEFSIDVCDDTGDEARRKGRVYMFTMYEYLAHGLVHKAQVLSVLALMVQKYKY